MMFLGFLFECVIILSRCLEIIMNNLTCYSILNLKNIILYSSNTISSWIIVIYKYSNIKDYELSELESAHK